MPIPAWGVSRTSNMGAMLYIHRLATLAALSLSLLGVAGEGGAVARPEHSALVAHVPGGDVRASAAQPAEIQNKLRLSVKAEAESAALAALQAAKDGPSKPSNKVLPTAGKPGDVRLVCVQTNVIERSRWIVPKLPIPPFTAWNKWLDEHPFVTHCALDWMDEQGAWWRTELRSYHQCAARYRVGQGEFRATGTTTYGIFILPGRSDPESYAVLVDEKINADYRKIIEIACEYGRKDKRRGEPGTGGTGERNVGLGGPAWRPSCNSNTYISYILRRLGIERPTPEGALGWERVPVFPYSSDADAYQK